MPVCDGRPCEACPNAASGRNVKFAQGDLFLCSDCEEFRFPSTSSTRMRSTRQKRDKTQAEVNKSAKPGKNKITKQRKEKMESNVATCDNNDVLNDVLNNSDDDEDDGNSCPRCLLETKHQQTMMCDVCHQRIHQQCTAVPKDAYTVFLQYAKLIGWVCDDCKDTFRSTCSRLQSAISTLSEELAQVKVELANAKSQFESHIENEIKKDDTSQIVENYTVENTETDGKNTESRISLVVHKTLHDASRRKRNIIISGLPKEPDVNDSVLFDKFCEYNMPIKPAVSERGCLRIGKAEVGKPRRLLVRLTSEESARALLLAAPTLRGSSDKRIAGNIYINEDLSPIEARLAYEARQKRRERKEMSKRLKTSEETSTDSTCTTLLARVTSISTEVTPAVSTSNGPTSVADVSGISDHMASVVEPATESMIHGKLLLATEVPTLLGASAAEPVKRTWLKSSNPDSQTSFL
jgi:hypothetical protein